MAQTENHSEAQAHAGTNNQTPTSTDRLGLIVKIMAAMFLLNLLFDRGMQLLPIYTLADSFSVSDTLAVSLTLPYFWTGLLVPICYLYALWAAAYFLQQFEANQEFNQNLLSALQRIGGRLMGGAIAAMLIVPSIESWINHGSRALKLDWQVEPVTIGMIGLIIKLVARRAAQAQGQPETLV
jgi:hypothetical protein